jgi:hypothetical protein
MDLKQNYPEIDDIEYEALLKMDIGELHKLCVRKKLQAKMTRAATKIQRKFRLYIF